VVPEPQPEATPAQTKPEVPKSDSDNFEAESEDLGEEIDKLEKMFREY
jgi:hypothetical protein